MLANRVLLAQCVFAQFKTTQHLCVANVASSAAALMLQDLVVSRKWCCSTLAGHVTQQCCSIVVCKLKVL